MSASIISLINSLLVLLNLIYICSVCVCVYISVEPLCLYFLLVLLTLTNIFLMVDP